MIGLARRRESYLSEKVADQRYRVTLLLDGEPVKRPWMNDALTIDMSAQYSFDAVNGADFVVAPWPPGQRFAAHLTWRFGGGTR